MRARVLRLLLAATAVAGLTLAAAPAQAADAKVGPGKVVLTVDGVTFATKVDGRVSLAGLKRNLAAMAPRVKARSTARYLATHRGVAAPRSVLINHGQRWYYPAMAWSNNATITVGVEYGIEEFTGGCRPYSYFEGYRNGSPWSLQYAVDDFALTNDAGTATFRLWLGTYTRSGNGYVAAPSLYQSGGPQNLKAWPADTRAKGATEGTWHYHYGTSYTVSLDC